MRALGKIVTISLLTVALAVACKRDVAPSVEKREPAAATPVNATAATKTEAPGVCAPTTDESCGCAHQKAAAGAAAEKPLVPITEAKVGDRTMCPVMNTAFVVLPDSPKVELAGKTYWFCCDGCAKQFEANPKQFVDS